MKILNSECFILESQLSNVVTELRESKVKSLTLNISVKRNLQKLSEICNEFRKDIQEFVPERLKELNTKTELTEEETEEKSKLDETTNAEINKLLQEPIEFTPFNCGVNVEALGDIELSFDATNIIDILFSNPKE
jgi:hypothetical protein